MPLRFFVAASLLWALGGLGCSNRGVQKAAGTKISVRVKWTKSPDSDVTGYRIYQGDNADFSLDGLDFLAAGPNATSIVVADVPSGKRFFKIVSVGTLPAVNGKGGVSAPVLVSVDVP